jgi:hypothetical protein
MKAKINLSNKHISELTQDDTIYVRRKGNMSQTALCRFQSYGKGSVQAVTIPCERWETEETIKAKLENCALYGVSEPGGHAHYHWFRPDGYAIRHDPALVKDDPKKYEDRHPSYVRLSLFRTSATPPVTLLGSPIPHSHFITLRVQKAVLKHDPTLNEDRIFGEAEIAQFAMSKNQLADLLTRSTAAARRPPSSNGAGKKSPKPGWPGP